MHSHLRGHPALIHAVRHLERLNADEFEIYFERQSVLKAESKNQEIETFTQSNDAGLSIRLVKDQKMGFSFTTSLDETAIERAVRSAVDVAAVMPADELAGVLSFGEIAYPHLENYDSRGKDRPLADKIALAKQLEAECRKADSRISGIRSAAFTQRVSEVHLVDSHGEHIQHQNTLFSASVTCKAEHQGDSQSASEFTFSDELDRLDIPKTGRLAAQWATEMLGAKSVQTMICPAILRNSVVADLIEFLASSFSAEQIDKGRSMLAGKKGQHLFSDQVTLIDDGLLPGGAASSPFDGEGTPCSQTTLVHNGFLTNWLADGYYSRKLGIPATGNADRGIKSAPVINPTNLYLKPGMKTEARLLDGVSKGILITDLMGVHTANPVTGDFSLGASGILVEHGKLIRPVRGFAVAGNVLELFQRMTDIGNDLKFFGGIGAPSVRISELSVAGD